MHYSLLLNNFSEFKMSIIKNLQFLYMYKDSTQENPKGKENNKFGKERKDPREQKLSIFMSLYNK